MINPNADFVNAFNAFFEGCAALCAENDKRFPSLEPSVLSSSPGKKYIKIIKDGPGGPSKSVYAFVNVENGDVLKPAGWAAPAKHARGNIYDAKNGLGSMSAEGPAYLR